MPCNRDIGSTEYNFILLTEQKTINNKEGSKMQTGFTKIALIPAYEPTCTLLDLIAELSAAHFQIVLVDDGSGEKYRWIFSSAMRYGEVLIQNINKGKGSALKTGLAYIKRHYPKNAVVVTLDADGQHSVNDAQKVAEASYFNAGNLVLGCRSFVGNVPARSRFGNSVTRFVYRITTGVNVSDTQTGLRAFDAEMIPLMLSIAGERYEYEMNVLLECSRKKIPINEVKIETIYIDDNSSSHFSTVKDSFRIYRDILKFAASSLTGFVVDYGLYSLLVLVTGGLGTAVSIPLSNVMARVVSASVNYTINKRFVFKNDDNVAKTAGQYFALAALILALNTLLLSLLVNFAGINEYAAKIFTELSFFAMSWVAQKYFIFGKKPENKKSIIESNGVK